VDEALHNAIHSLDHDEDRFAEALAAQGSSREQFDTDNRANAEKAVRTQLLVDAIADKLDIQVGQNDITQRLIMMSQQYGMEPQQLLAALQENNQLAALFADVRRGLAVAQVVEDATVSDSNGEVVDTSEFFGREGAEAATPEADEAAPAADEASAEASEDASEDEETADTK
jgi:trigger factor